MATYYFAIDALDFEESRHTVTSRHDRRGAVCAVVVVFAGIVIAAISFLLCKAKKQRRAHRASQGENFIYVVSNSRSSS